MSRTRGVGRHRRDERFSPAFEELAHIGDVGKEITEYVGARRLRVGFTPQKNSGARWFDWRRLRFGVFVNADYASDSPGAPHIAALIAHEVKHLQQGLHKALSVRGELAAWQVQYDVLDALSAAPQDPRWRQLRKLDPGSREDLLLAKSLIKRLGGRGYHIELLPLLPFGEQMGYWVRCIARRFRSRCRRARPADGSPARREES